MVLLKPKMRGSKAKCECDLKGFKRLHLPIKPLCGIRPIGVCPTEASANVLHLVAGHPFDGVEQAMIFKVKPLAKADAAIPRKLFCRGFFHSIAADEAEVVVAVVGRPFGLFVAGLRGPRGREIEETVPVDACGLVASSAPNDETPTSDTHTGRPVMA